MSLQLQLLLAINSNKISVAHHVIKSYQFQAILIQLFNNIS